MPRAPLFSRRVWFYTRQKCCYTFTSHLGKTTRYRFCLKGFVNLCAARRAKHARRVFAHTRAARARRRAAGDTPPPTRRTADRRPKPEPPTVTHIDTPPTPSHLHDPSPSVVQCSCALLFRSPTPRVPLAFPTPRHRACLVHLFPSFSPFVPARRRSVSSVSLC